MMSNDICVTKEISLFISIMVGMGVSPTYAYDIENTWMAGDLKHYQVVCTNGTTLDITYVSDREYKPYMVNGGEVFNTLDEAANQSCAKASKMAVVKAGAIIFKNQRGDHSIENTLSSDIGYELTKRAGGYEDMFINDKDAKVHIVSHHSGTNLIDSYYKIKDRDGYFFVRKSEVK